MARFVDLDDSDDAGSAGPGLGHAGYAHPVGHGIGSHGIPSAGGPHDGGPRAEGVQAPHHEGAMPVPMPMPVPVPMPGHLIHHHVEPRLKQSDRDVQEPSSPSYQNPLQHESQRQLFINKLKLLSAASRDGPWPHSLYNPKPIGIMDANTFQSPVTDALQCYP